MSQITEIEIGGKVYSVAGGGTNVIPNPEETGEEILLKTIQIDNVNYTLNEDGKWSEVELITPNNLTGPNEKVFSSSNYDSNRLPWKAFNGIKDTTASNCWSGGEAVDSIHYIGYNFDEGKKISQVNLYYTYDNTFATVCIQGKSINGTKWIDLSDDLILEEGVYKSLQTYEFTCKEIEVESIRIVFKNSKSPMAASSYGINISEIEVYGKNRIPDIKMSASDIVYDNTYSQYSDISNVQEILDKITGGATGNIIYNIKTTSMSTAAAKIMIQKSDGESIEITHNEVQSSPIIFDDTLNISYSGGWILKSEVDGIIYDNNVYNTGDTIKTWLYTTDVDFDVVKEGIFTTPSIYSKVESNPDDLSTEATELTGLRVDGVDFKIAAKVEALPAKNISYDDSNTDYNANNVQDILVNINNGRDNSDYYTLYRSSSSSSDVIIKLYNSNGEILDTREGNVNKVVQTPFHNLRFVWTGNFYVYVVDNSLVSIIYKNNEYAPGEQIGGNLWGEMASTITLTEKSSFSSGASFINYDNNNSKLEATNVQSAIDELALKISSLTRISESEDKF